jgi:hypothetical protein
METLTDWDKVPGPIAKLIIGTFKKALKSRGDKMGRVFNLAKPKITIGENNAYWRIEPDHGVLLKKLIGEYI